MQILWRITHSSCDSVNTGEFQAEESYLSDIYSSRNILAFVWEMDWNRTGGSKAMLETTAVALECSKGDSPGWCMRWCRVIGPGCAFRVKLTEFANRLGEECEDRRGIKDAQRFLSRTTGNVEVPLTELRSEGNEQLVEENQESDCGHSQCEMPDVPTGH